jgi:hypothetical protein
MSRMRAARNLMTLLGSAAGTVAAGLGLMDDKEDDKPKDKPAPAPEPAPAPAPSAASKAKPRVRPGSEGVPEEKKSETRKAFEREFAAARRRGDVTFEFNGKPYSSRLGGESEAKHKERMADAAKTQRMEDRLAAFRRRKGLPD